MNKSPNCRRTAPSLAGRAASAAGEGWGGGAPANTPLKYKTTGEQPHPTPSIYSHPPKASYGVAPLRRIAIHRKLHTVLRRLTVQPRTVFGDASCLKLSVDGYTTAYCLQRRALSETFGGWLYIHLSAQRVCKTGSEETAHKYENMNKIPNNRRSAPSLAGRAASAAGEGWGGGSAREHTAEVQNDKRTTPTQPHSFTYT